MLFQVEISSTDDFKLDITKMVMATYCGLEGHGPLIPLCRLFTPSWYWYWTALNL